MPAILAPYLPYLLPMLVIAINEVVAHNENIKSNSLLSLIYNAVIAGLKAAIGKNPPPAV